MKKTIFSLALMSLVLIACKKDVETPDNSENEQITTLSLIITKIGSTDTIKASYKDLDGAGGNPPVFDTINLKANVHYSVYALFLDESKTPAVNISTEINNEGDEHRVFYTFKNGKFNPVISDVDLSTLLPIGLRSSWHTTQPGTDTVTITLKHMPDGTKQDNINVGSTDAEVKFPISVTN